MAITLSLGVLYFTILFISIQVSKLLERKGYVLWRVAKYFPKLSHQEFPNVLAQ